MGTTGDVVKKTIPQMACVNMKFDDAEIEHFIDLVKDAKNYANSYYKINVDEMRTIYKKLLQ